MGARRGNNPEIVKQNRVKEEEERIIKALDQIGVHEWDDYRDCMIEEALSFDPGNREKGNMLRLQWLNNGKAQARIIVHRFVPNSNIDKTDLGLSYASLEAERDLCMENIDRFNLSEIMDEVPVVFQVE